MLNFSKNKFINWLIIILFILVILNIISYFLLLRFPEGIEKNIYLIYFDELFNLNLESNIPTFFSVFLTLIASVLAFIIAKIKKEKSIGWFFVSFLFLFLAVDDLAQIHERVNNIIASYELNGFFSGYGWVSIYIIFLLLIIIFGIKFILSLPEKIKILFFIAIVIIIGALLFEIVGGMCVDDQSLGYNSIIYKISTTLEEFLEMVAMIVFVKIFLDYIQDLKPKIQIKLLK